MARKNTSLIIAIVLIVGSIAYLQFIQSRATPGDKTVASVPAGVRMDKKEKARRYEAAKELAGIAGFLNTEAVSVGELIGKKVILVDFWTYSCINCQRTTPYLNAWYEKYRDQGLEIIGVHTPEFEFEKEYENVEAAVRKFGIEYPVALDNAYATWRNYGNRYWPRKYLIDIDGYIVYDHIGEGGYAETEQTIQSLLRERMDMLAMEGEIAGDVVQPKGVLAVDPTASRSPEIYFGAARNEFLGNGVALRQGVQTFEKPDAILLNKLYLTGEWEIGAESAKNVSGDATIIFRYQGKAVYMVASAEEGVTVTVFRDGKLIDTAGGVDVKDGMVRIEEDRLYELVEDSTYGEHTLEIRIENPGLQAFTFTFG